MFYRVFCHNRSSSSSIESPISFAAEYKSLVQTLTFLDLCESEVQNESLEIIINSFPSLETLTISWCVEPSFNISSPPPPATKTLRSLTMEYVDSLSATQFIPHFSNLRELVLRGRYRCQDLDLCLLTSSLALLSDLSLTEFTLENTESLKNLVHLSSLRFKKCPRLDLSFLTQENSPYHLTALFIDSCFGLSTSSFSSLTLAPSMKTLEIVRSDFNNNCLQHLENMVHLRKLDLSFSKNIVGGSRSLKTLMRNLFQLEELNLHFCPIGNQGAIAGTLFSTHSRLRVLKLGCCNLVDDDLDGIGALKNTLEVLDLIFNKELTNEALVHCKDLVELKILDLYGCVGIGDLSPLKDCLNLEKLDVSDCDGQTDNSFQVFSEEPNSFPNLRVLDLSSCEKLTEKVFEDLSNNNHLVYRLEEFGLRNMDRILLVSSSARNSLYRLQKLQHLEGIFTFMDPSKQDKLEDELMRSLKNLELITQ